MSFQNLQIDLRDLPQASAIAWRALDARHAVAHAIVATLVTGLLSTGISVLITLARDVEANLLPAALFVAAVAAASGLWTFASLRARRYAVREHDAAFARGLVFRRTTFVAFNRVQHVEVSRGPIDRAIGLATLKFFTAGGISADLAVPGLALREANALRARVVEQTDELG